MNLYLTMYIIHNQSSKHWYLVNILSPIHSPSAVDRGEKIKLIPWLSKVRTVIHNEAQSDELDKKLKQEEVCKNLADNGVRPHDNVVFVQILDVCFEGQLRGWECNQEHYESIEIAMVLSVVAGSTKQAILAK